MHHYPDSQHIIVFIQDIFVIDHVDHYSHHGIDRIPRDEDVKKKPEVMAR